MWAKVTAGSIAMLGAALVAWTQKPQDQPPPEESATIKVDVSLVNVLFSVRDKRGGLVGNLEQKDFTVFEDGKPQEIRSFSRETALPLTIGLLVDVSVSQGNLIEVERRAASQFFSQVLRPKDLAFLISFGSEAELLQDYTGSAKLLRSALDQLRVNAQVGGLHPGPVPTASTPRGTILFDAVYLAASEKLKGEVGRKAMVLITDGVDQGSRYTRGQAIEAAHRSDAIVYSVYYVDPQFYGWGGGGGDGDLKRMSEDTGGRLYRVDRKHTLQEIFDELQQELRTQYAISYSPANQARDGGFRKIEIKTADKDLRVQARKGYYAEK
jgi:VWFA-related protein